jgi:hypothetical protein
MTWIGNWKEEVIGLSDTLMIATSILKAKEQAKG